WPMSESGTAQTNWTGTWYGETKAYPEGAIGNGYNVTFEIGPYPMVDHSCTTWRSIFKEHDTIKLTKDNRLCRERGPDDLYIVDGLSGAKVAVQWIHNVFVSSFKHQGVFAVAKMQMRGDILEEEIVITADNPAIENVMVSVRTHSIHLKTLRRASTPNNGEKSFRSSLFLIYIIFFLRFSFLIA
ncbi:unnamed protein product, partial [Rotaria sp. Silwood2]